MSVLGAIWGLVSGYPGSWMKSSYILRLHQTFGGKLPKDSLEFTCRTPFLFSFLPQHMPLCSYANNNIGWAGHLFWTGVTTCNSYRDKRMNHVEGCISNSPSFLMLEAPLFITTVIPWINKLWYNEIHDITNNILSQHAAVMQLVIETWIGMHSCQKSYIYALVAFRKHW